MDAKDNSFNSFRLSSIDASSEAQYSQVLVYLERTLGKTLHTEALDDLFSDRS